MTKTGHVLARLQATPQAFLDGMRAGIDRRIAPRLVKSEADATIVCAVLIYYDKVQTSTQLAQAVCESFATVGVTVVTTELPLDIEIDADDVTVDAPGATP